MASTSSLPLCFSASADPLAHNDGDWRPRSTTGQPYRLPIGTVMDRHWSQACWNTSFIMEARRVLAPSKTVPSTPTRPGFDYFNLNMTPPVDVVWTPRRCRLQHRLPDSGSCAAFQNNISILIVGDSVTSQLTLSLASMLGGRIGRNFKYTPTGALTDFAATGCGGRIQNKFRAIRLIVVDDQCQAASSRAELRDGQLRRVLCEPRVASRLCPAACWPSFCGRSGLCGAGTGRGMAGAFPAHQDLWSGSHRWSSRMQLPQSQDLCALCRRTLQFTRAQDAMRCCGGRS